MKTVCLALCVVAASAAFTELTLDSKFESFKAEHGKTYATAEAEATARSVSDSDARGQPSMRGSPSPST